jgi:hypothetical protein
MTKRVGQRLAASQLDQRAINWLLLASSVFQSCPACQRKEAAGGYCTACHTRTSIQDWSTTDTAFEKYAERHLVAPEGHTP